MQNGQKAVVNFHGKDLFCFCRKAAGKASDARPDLQNGGVPIGACAFGNLFGDALGNQKVLPEGLGKMEGMAFQ